MSDHPPLTANSLTRTVFRIASLFTTLAVAMGSVVCATKSSAACPNWPGCYRGQLVPEIELNPMIEFVHRVVAVSTGPLVLLAALMALRLTRRDMAARVLPWIALAGGFVAGFVGMLLIKHGSVPKWVGMVDLLSSLVAMLAMTAATVHVERSTLRPSAPTAARSAWAAVGVLLFTHALGIAVSGNGSYTRCMSWPLWGALEADYLPWLQWVRTGLAVVAIALVVRAVLQVRDRLRVVALLAVGLLVANVLLGFFVPNAGQLLETIYSILAVTTLWAIGLLAARCGLARTGPDHTGASLSEADSDAMLRPSR